MLSSNQVLVPPSGQLNPTPNTGAKEESKKQDLKRPEQIATEPGRGEGLTDTKRSNGLPGLGNWAKAFQDNFDLGDTHKRLYLALGQRFWTFTGPSNAKASPKWYRLLNSLGGSLHLQATENLSYIFSGQLMHGQAPAGGSFLGYRFGGRLVWHQDASQWTDGIVGNLLLGARAKLHGLGVGGNQFGGYDLLLMGLLAELSGVHDPAFIQSKLKWHFAISLTPIALGQIGYRNQFHMVKSTFGFSSEASCFMVSDSSTVDFGLGIEYAQQGFYDQSSNESKYTELGIALLAKTDL